MLFRPTANNPSDYKGFLNGPDAAQTSITVADYSLTGTIFRENTGDLDWSYISSWEVNFFLAEAAERGLISASAQNLYEIAVQQAFDYWMVPMPSNYLSSGNAAYGNVDALEQIATQKWMANCINGYESWIEYRRTGYPKLKTVAASLNNNLIPVRMPYPTDEAALNPNYQEAAANTNGNSINAPTWWDVN